MEAPVLPRDLMAVQLEAGAARLLPAKRASLAALRTDRLRIVVALPGRRHGYGSGVDDAQDLLRVHVPDDDQPLDGAAVTRRTAAALEAGEALKPAAALLRGSEEAGSAASAVHRLEIRDAAPPHGRD